MIFLISFGLITLIQTSYYLFFRFRFPKIRIPKKQQKFGVSVIICAKNEARNLSQNLQYIANQNYSNFEIVLVNDHSTDTTLLIMQDFKNKYPNLPINIVNLSGQTNTSKKHALTKGIENAQFEHLLLTDADCYPISNLWIQQMVNHFFDKTDVILGYGAYQKIENSFLNKIIRLETLYTAMQYFSYANSGLTYMAVGRNLAYKKSVFQKVNGFQKHINIKSGDDDLLINQIATKSNVNCNIHPKSFTVSKPKKSWKLWIQQKRRHITTASHYKISHQLLLGVFYISQLSFWLFLFYTLFSGFYLKQAIILLIIRLIGSYIAINHSAKALKEKDLIGLAPIYEISVIFIQLYLFVVNLIAKPKHW